MDHAPYDDMDWGEIAVRDTTHIPPRPGYVQRWMRTEIRGVPDVKNVTKRYRQHWRPRATSTIEKTFGIPTVDFEGTEVIGVRGSILVERPEAINAKHREYNTTQALAQLSAANPFVGPSINRYGEPTPVMNVQTQTIFTEPTIDD